MKKIIFLTVALIIVAISIAGSKVSFAGAVIARPAFGQTGSITVISEDANGNAVGASWTLSGPTTISGGGVKSETFTGEPVGTYTIAIPTAPTGYSLASVSPAQSQTLNGNGSMTFGIVWQPTNTTAPLVCQFGTAPSTPGGPSAPSGPTGGGNPVVPPGGGGGGTGGGATSTQSNGYTPTSFLSFTCYTFADGTVSCWCPPGSSQVGSSCVLSQTCDENPDAAGCPSACETNPDDPSCNVCAQNPNDPQCQSQSCPTIPGASEAQQPIFDPGKNSCVTPNSDSSVYNITSGIVGGGAGYSCNAGSCEESEGGAFDDSGCDGGCTAAPTVPAGGGGSNGCNLTALQGYNPTGQGDPGYGSNCAAGEGFCDCTD